MEAATHPTHFSHEAYIHAIRDIVVRYQSDAAVRDKLLGVKLVYGIGAGHYRGICHYGAWQNGSATDFLEIAATGEESPTQLAGTTIHELAHVLAHGAGHGAQWKTACLSLGLTATSAAGQDYAPEHFAPHIWEDIAKLAPSDGSPLFNTLGRARFIGLRTAVLKPCPLGIGTRGGKSRGVGSGSRMRKFICACLNPQTGKPIPTRRACDIWDATCNQCGQRLTRADDSEASARVNANEPAQVAADSK